MPMNEFTQLDGKSPLLVETIFSLMKTFGL